MITQSTVYPKPGNSGQQEPVELPDTIIRGFAPFAWALIDHADQMVCPSADGSAPVCLRDKDKIVIAALLRFLSKGSPCVDPHQDTLALAAGCSERTLRRSLSRLKLLGLVQWRHKRHPKTRHITGTIYDLTGYLRLLPAKLLRTLRLFSLLRPKMSGSSTDATGQQALPFPAAAEPENAASGGEGEPPTYRPKLAGQEQDQALLGVKQQTAPVGEPDQGEKTISEDQRVVALLRQKWPDGTRMGWARAWLCFKRRGAAVCLEQIEALPHRKPKRNWAGLLSDSILKEVGGWELPASLLIYRREIARREQREAAGRAAAEERSRVVAQHDRRRDRRDTLLANLTPDEWQALLLRTRTAMEGRDDPVAAMVRSEPYEALTEFRQVMVREQMLKVLLSDERGDTGAQRAVSAPIAAEVGGAAAPHLGGSTE